jgi:feruloyl esterase
MRRFVHAVIIAVPALVGGASAVHAADANCTGTLTGTISGNLVVPSGASCTLSNATVTGNVRVQQNASLIVDATQQPATIGGSVQATNCAFALLEGGVTVNGNVRIVQCAQKSGFVGPGLKIDGNFHCTDDPGGCEADLGAVGGNVLVQGNGSTAASDISLVSVGGNLVCQSNTPAPTHAFGPDFVSGNLQGQCAANLGFASTTAAPSCVASTLNVPNVTVTSAALVSASTITVAAGTFTVPEYCQVIGVVATSGDCPATGPFAAPSGPSLIGCDTPGSPEFRLKLPTVWNGHFLFEGCGGSCGSVTSTSVNPLDAAEALGLGYAVVNTDTGHEQDPATLDYTWAVSESTPPVVNNSAIIDFYYRAVHQVTVATKQYVEAYYSQPIDYAYFDGCSTGGRQAMMEATRYPVDYDGVIAGDPAIAYHSIRTSTFKQAKAFIPTGAWIPYPSAAFPSNPNTVAAVDAAVTASCDAVDGVIDGLIQNTAACNILPSALGPAGLGILTATQQAGLQAYLLPETDTSGLPLFPGMPITDLSTAGFEGQTETTFAPGFPNSPEPWNLATQGQPLPTGGGAGPASWSLGEGGIKTYIEENQHFDVNDDWPERVSATGNTISDATAALLYAQAGLGNSDDPFTLANFLRKGGKVIMYHGGSDSLITPFRTFWYYEQLASLHGGYRPTQNSVRLFIEPGMGHCGGGSTQTPNSFDTLQALHNWVTKGVAPEGIVATATNGRTMPLCKFPEEASYLGGDVNLAASWTCNASDTRMLQVGTAGGTAGAGAATAHQYLIDPIPIGLNGQ